MIGQGPADTSFGRTYWIYIRANQPRGVFYVGTASDLARRLRPLRGSGA